MGVEGRVVDERGIVEEVVFESDGGEKVGLVRVGWMIVEIVSEVGVVGGVRYGMGKGYEEKGMNVFNVKRWKKEDFW